MEDNIHAKHRQRVRKRFLRDGLDGFEDHEVLELVLFNSIKIEDTNPTAHRLMKHFGSLSAVFDASFEELLKVKGVGETSAVLIMLFTQVYKKYSHDGVAPELLLSSNSAGKFLIPYFMGLKNEHVYAVCVDSKLKVLKCEKVCEGSYNSADVSVRRIAEIAMATKATGIIIAHNHPNGVALPSEDDLKITKILKSALGTLNILLYDHIIVADSEFVSMRDTYEWIKA